MSGEEVDIDSLGIKALKEFITEAGLSTADCIDKNDLRARAREAAAAKASAPPASSSSAESASSSSRKTMKIGVYECIVQGPPELINGSGPVARAKKASSTCSQSRLANLLVAASRILFL